MSISVRGLSAQLGEAMSASAAALATAAHGWVDHRRAEFRLKPCALRREAGATENDAFGAKGFQPLARARKAVKEIAILFLQRDFRGEPWKGAEFLDA
jgi:hypothetical protein